MAPEIKPGGVIGFSCARCTRIFVVPQPPQDDRLPRHLDMLIGVPCTGGGDQVWFYT